MKLTIIRATTKLATDAVVGSDPDPDHAGEKHTSRANDHEQSSDEEKPSEGVQEGIKKVEAVTLTWTGRELLLAYLW